ncbi:MAG: M48 family metallopeptidase [Pseudomonadota bacterium]
MMETAPVAAKYFDGSSAKKHTVTAHLAQRHGAQVLVITGYGADEILWPASELREVTDQAREEGIVLSQGQSGIARVIVPHGDAERAIRSVAANLGKRQVTGRQWRKVGLWASGAVASVLLILFIILPALANTLATMIPPAREQALGDQTLEQISGFLGGEGADDMTCSDPAGLAALEKMTARLAGNRTFDYDLEIRVFDHGMINAFAVPGGNVVLFDGLLEAATSPEEVAGVLAHEIAHVVNRDPTRLTLRTAGSVGILGMVFGDFAGGAVALVLVERLMNASYSQEAETAADNYAHVMLAEADLPSTPFAEFFETLRAKHGDSEGFMSHLASHPNLAGRAKAAEEADTVGGAAYAPVLNASEWAALKAICD